MSNDLFCYGGEWMEKGAFQQRMIAEGKATPEQYGIIEPIVEEVVEVKEEVLVEEPVITEVKEEAVTATEELKAKYKEQTGKDVPNRYKNDFEWISSKLI